MLGRHRQLGRNWAYAITLIWLILIVPLSAVAAPYAAMVMDARSGEVLHSRNADTRLHPASLTKMMTLYVAFEAIEHGEIGLDDMVTISKFAASEPPSKLGLRAGQKIKMRYLIRAAAVKSANDAATAIGEALEGSEAAFARRMNRTAKALGMTRTTFKNAHGLTESGHLSTARDMTILGRHVLYDYPEYYNLFSRRTTDAGIKTVPNTNRRLLANYKGADGIKTGYTRAAGFNLVASAERGQERIIATVFGGTSSVARNAKVAELLDMGFKRAPTRVALRKPGRPGYVGKGKDGAKRVIVADARPTIKPQGQAKSIRVAAAAVPRSLRPNPRPGSTVQAQPPAQIASLKASIEDAVRLAASAPAPKTQIEELTQVAALATPRVTSDIAPDSSLKPPVKPRRLVLASAGTTNVRRAAPKPEVITRISTSGGRHWGINVGRYSSRYQAEKVLLKTALAEMATLDGSLRKVTERSTGYDANFMGLTRETADLACRRLQARQMTCFMIEPRE